MCLISASKKEDARVFKLLEMPCTDKIHISAGIGIKAGNTLPCGFGLRKIDQNFAYSKSVSRAYSPPLLHF